MADLSILPAVLQRQAEKKADEQRRRRERKRKKTGPIEVCQPTIGSLSNDDGDGNDNTAKQ